MRKKRWSNLFGTALGAVTVTATAIASNRAAKKYGQKIHSFGIDKTYLFEYAVNKFLASDYDKADTDDVQ